MPVPLTGREPGRPGACALLRWVWISANLNLLIWGSAACVVLGSGPGRLLRRVGLPIGDVPVYFPRPVRPWYRLLVLFEAGGGGELRKVEFP